MKKVFNNSNIHQIITGISEDRRFIKKNEDLFDTVFCKNACIFSMPISGGLKTLIYLPPETRVLYFYLGANIEDLLGEIKNSEIIDHLEYLTIGLTKGNARHLNYSKVSAILAGMHFPNLRFFEYGVDFLLENEHCLYGNLGNITPVLDNMPKLETLQLFGNFTIDRPLSFPHVTDDE